MIKILWTTKRFKNSGNIIQISKFSINQLTPFRQIQFLASIFHVLFISEKEPQRVFANEKFVSMRVDHRIRTEIIRNQLIPIENDVTDKLDIGYLFTLAL